MVKYNKTYIGNTKIYCNKVYNRWLEFHYNDPVIGLKYHYNRVKMSL